MLSLLRGIASEYGEAFDDGGRLVRRIELDEAALLLAEARDLNDRLRVVAPEELLALDRDLRGATLPVPVFTDRVELLARRVSEATGLRDEPLPPEPPSAARGAVIFAENCTRCHGAGGAGDGADAKQLGITPADFTAPAFMRGETPLDFFNMITLGRRRSGMPEWNDALTVQQRWDAVAHVWTLSRSPQVLAEGQGIWIAQCAGCHGASGDGKGPLADGLLTPVPDLTTAGSLVESADDRLFAVVQNGVPGTAMPAFGTTLDERQRWSVVAFTRALALGGLGGAPTVAGVDAATPLDPAHPGGAIAATHRLLDQAVAARRAGDPRVNALATDAYAAFEPLEPRLGALDATRVRAVEEGFVRVRTALRAPGREVDAALAQQVAELHAELDRAAAVLEPGATSRADTWARFVQSAGIILREGFEMVLIVGALLAYVRRSGHTALVRSIHLGAAGGVVASIVTAVALESLLVVTPGTGAVLEGAALLLAAVVLFWVSYWLISKAEADRWQRYIQTRVRRALATGSGTALAAAAFLAVYREGFEIILFYQALLAMAPARDLIVPAGFVAGLMALGVVHLVLRRLGMRVPIATFFTVTGGFLYAMAIVFAGKGVFELQEAGLVGFTPLPWAPRIDALGVYPCVETLAAQGVLVLLLVYAIWATAQRRSAARVEALRAEVAELRARVEALPGPAPAGVPAPGSPSERRPVAGGRAK